MKMMLMMRDHLGKLVSRPRACSACRPYPFAILLLKNGVRVLFIVVGCYFECLADG
jgi:hypothetical protein